MQEIFGVLKITAGIFLLWTAGIFFKAIIKKGKTDSEREIKYILMFVFTLIGAALIYFH